jgi:hypothetical protein
VTTWMEYVSAHVPCLVSTNLFLFLSFGVDVDVDMYQRRNWAVVVGGVSDRIEIPLPSCSLRPSPTQGWIENGMDGISQNVLYTASGFF